MATSGSIDFTVTAEEIITEALELLGVLGEDETPSTGQLTSSMRTLNMLTKSWQADGLNLFSVKRLFLFIEKEKVSYELSSSTQDHFTTAFFETTTTVAASSGASTITVEDATDISTGDFIGIYNTNAELQWTFVDGAPVSNVVTLFATLDFDVDEGSVVYNYPATNTANRPMLVLEAYNQIFNATAIPLDLISRVDYYELTNRTTGGVINQVYYDPQIGTGANLFVWPTGDDERNFLELLTQRTLEDFDSSVDNPDYPQEWYMPLATNLARALAPKYGTPQMDYSRLMQQAREWYTMAKGFDSEIGTSMYIRPDTWGNDLP